MDGYHGKESLHSRLSHAEYNNKGPGAKVNAKGQMGWPQDH